MDQGGMTNEFSICLLLDKKSTKAIDDIRQVLAASPYRDDTPHITLLRTIKTPSSMSDNDLLRDMERLLKLSKSLPLSVSVHKPANRFSPLFRTSSLVILRASPDMRTFRKNILRTLKANNYSVGIFERLIFLPHISVRLGVSHTTYTKAMAEHSFRHGAVLSFNKWIVLRDIKNEGKYLVKEIFL